MLDERAALGGRVAVITGGAGGLGRPITLDLARAGARLAVCDRDPSAIETITAELTQLGAEFLIRCFDVRDRDALAALFADVDNTYGTVDILVSVPGGSYTQPSLELTAKGTSAVIEQNFTHVLEASRLAAARMRSSGNGGSIVTVSTVEAYRAMPEMAVYGAMKAGVEQLSKTLAVEWGRHGIRVNTVAPDHFPTEHADRIFGSSRHPESHGIVIPLARKGAPHELSACVLFLASDLSSYVTGTTILVDGGTLAAAGWMRWPDGYANLIPDHIIDRLQPEEE